MSVADTAQRPPAPVADPGPDVVAAGARAVLAVAVDVALGLAPLLVVPLLGATRLAGGWAWTIAVALVLAAAAVLLLDLTRTGRSPGRRLLRVRTVAAATQLPPTVAELLRREVHNADLSAGRDPLRLVPRGTTPLQPAVWEGWQQSLVAGTGGWLLVIDGGEPVALTGSTLVGRDPTNAAGQQHALVAVPDLTRSISRVHALLEPADDCVWLTDSGTTNGTRAASASASGGTVIERWLRPGERVPVRDGGIVHLGDRELRITRSTHPGA
ncbi:FHA domain-containing protein [Micropruina sp.]|uniref:FHA domain-containing protein n=1 Tax=Micropruina sp. TaxID=2737536 RepID=UPI0039E2D102